jgi:protein HIRA/HIR1
MQFTDVTDLAWSPEDRYLASVGLDSQVLIWSGYTLGTPRLLPINCLLNIG